MERERPHFDKPRRTPFGTWMTNCRIQAGLRQSDLSPVLGGISPGLSNQGRPNELETGKRKPTPDVIEGLYTFFRKLLGDNCPPPPEA